MRRARVGVIGASGYAGAELMRLLSSHPGADVVFASGSTSAGQKIADLYPSLSAVFPELTLGQHQDAPARLDAVFLALPHGASQKLVQNIDSSALIDLGADFRFSDVSTYEGWYGSAHRAPDLNGNFAYGLVELFRDEIAQASSVSVPGCYPTASILTMAPLLAAGLVEPSSVVVNAISGVSGAGREPKPGTIFGAVAENVAAYGVATHRHTPEMEEALGRIALEDVSLVFTPHLAPMNRGILATCYMRPTGTETQEDLLDAMSTAYKGEPFVSVTERLPSTKTTHGSNSIHITVRRDHRTGWVIAIGALDNLGKGAAGQAVQCANVMLGFEETAGLAIAGVYP